MFSFLCQHEHVKMCAGLDLAAQSCSPEGFTTESISLVTQAIAEATAKAIIRATQTCGTEGTTGVIACVENNGWAEAAAYAVATAVRFQRPPCCVLLSA